MVEISAKNMAKKIEMWPISRLKPYEKNSRTHSEGQVEQIAASIVEFGFTNPVLVDKANGIIAGHGRVEAAKTLGLAEIPVIVLDYLTDAQRRAYIIADNKLALNAGWDFEKLAEELEALSEMEFDIGAIGFSDAEIAQLLSDSDGTNPADEWTDMPEFNQVDKTAHRTIPVHFANDADVAKFAALVGQTITEKTRSIWFPEAVIERYADKRYA